MTAADLIALLIETTLASSAAVLLVMLLRRPLRAMFGAGVAYAVWGLVPAALIAVLLPAATVAVAPMPTSIVRATVMAVPAAIATPAITVAAWVCAAWLLGVIVCLLRFVWQQHRFTRSLGRVQRRDDGLHQAEAIAGLPAAIGVLRPRIVLPADYATRYSDEQQRLMQAHERTHVARGDLQVNTFAAALRCVFWFNPLLHYAARPFRHDQELACDQRVIARHPHARRAYGEAMFKTQLAAQPLPLGCHWGHGHPLKERIEMLKQPVPTMKRVLVGSALVTAMTCVSTYAAWAAQPGSEAASSVPMTQVIRESRWLNPPKYPVAAAQQGIGGMVLLLVDIDAEGMPTAVNVEKSEPAGVFDAAAVEAAKRWRFNPVIENGKGVPSQARVPIAFEVPVKAASAQQSDLQARAMAPPKYPKGSKGISGRVIMLVDVGADGVPTAAEIEKSEPAGVFDAVSIEAVMKWRFNPALENGKPVASRVRVPIDFGAKANRGDGAIQAEAEAVRDGQG